MDYPETRRDDLVEQLHGRSIADPYRWLEDPDSAETADWVERQNAFTRSRLEGLAARGWFTETMNAVMHRPRAGVPSQHGGRYFLSRNNGFQNQNVVYVADTLDELRAGGRVIIDPNTMSADGTTSVLDYTVSDDGALLAYAASEGGSDWLDFHLLDVASGEPVVDAEIQTKFSVPAWLPDHRSYLYGDFDHEGRAGGTQTAALGGVKLRRHRIGEPQQADELIMEFPDDPQLMFTALVSRDHRFVVVPIVAGTENVNRVWVYRIIGTDEGSSLGEPIKLIDEPIAEFAFVRSVGDRLYFQTDLDAERGRVVLVDLAAFEQDGRLTFEEVVAESKATLSAVEAAGDFLITVGLDDAQPVLRRFDLFGTDQGSHRGPERITGGPERRTGRAGVLRRHVLGGQPDECLRRPNRFLRGEQPGRVRCTPSAAGVDRGRPDRRRCRVRATADPDRATEGTERRRDGGSVLLDQPG